MNRIIIDYRKWKIPTNFFLYWEYIINFLSEYGFNDAIVKVHTTQSLRNIVLHNYPYNNIIHLP